MSIIYFVRHGRTDWNRQGLFRGRADRPLDDVGHRQAALVAEFLSDRGIDTIYTSPMQRCVETVTPLRGKFRRASINIVAELVDIDYGQWQGVKKDDVQLQWPDQWDAWHSDPFGVTFPDGESLVDVQKRAFDGLGQIRNDAQDKTIVVCSHRVVLKALFCGFLGTTAKRAFYSLKADPASVTVVRFEGDLPVIESLNDTQHLRGDAPPSYIADF
jgi:broad specificity phosphatase PhoE